MHHDVAALLTVQEDDLAIHAIQTKLDELQPRLDALARDRDRARTLLEQAKQTASNEERRRAEVAARVAQHKALYDKNQTALNSITSMREATAATAQLEQARRMIDEDERELSAIGQRLQEANRLVEDRDRNVRDTDAAQAEGSASLVSDQKALTKQLNSARSARDEKAKAVPRSLLSQYERIAKKHVHAVFPVRGQSCGRCDTTIPMQRRNAMAGSAKTEFCEDCGVMLYSPD